MNMNQDHLSPLTPHNKQLGSPVLARVLVVDDTEDNLFLMTALLEDSYELLTASSGEEALAMVLSQAQPDLILLDIMMPDMDGYEVLRRLQTNPLTSSIPVIFLTALSTVEEEQLGLDLGAVDYITKPISPPLLMARVQSHLERSSNARRLQSLSEKLSRYLAPQVCQSLLDGSQQAKIHTERKKLTVFFSDIKDFTASTAKWQPEDITRLLNSYFSEMSRIAAEYGGTVDKFIGDAMVIFFGDPHSLGVREDALQCVKMAMAMQKGMVELQRQWEGMGTAKSFRIRIGINTGFCDVGNFGSDLRMDYTIIGPEVNLAARLEQAAEPGGILISGETYALVREQIEADQSVSIIAKGFSDPITAHAVRGLAGESYTSGLLLQRQLQGMRTQLGLDSLPSADRAAAALELRRMADQLTA
ncbi:MAG: adenylate/guanylate cyclase domain-containing protein [Pseudomonadota bacterium]